MEFAEYIQAETNLYKFLIRKAPIGIMEIDKKFWDAYQLLLAIRDQSKANLEKEYERLLNRNVAQ